MRLSKVTLGLGAYIVISACFMLQVRNWLFSTFGEFAVVTSFRLCFILVFVLTILYAFRLRLGLFKSGAIFGLFVLGYLFSMWQPYFSEKTHVFTYGLLGYLTLKDLIVGKKHPQLKDIALAVCFVSLVSALDEIFQGILPYRFAELRDFITNIISGALGIILLNILHSGPLCDNL